MKASNLIRSVLPLFICGLAAGTVHAQSSEPAKKSPPTLERRSDKPAMASLAEAPSGQVAVSMISLVVPRGTPLQIALDREVRVKKVGQPIQGRLMQPVYAFDKLVVPAGTEVTGRISAIEPITRKKRFLSLLNADLTPSRKVQIEFDDLVMPNGTRMPIDTTVAPGSGHVVQMVAAGGNKPKPGLKDKAEEKIAQEKQQARQEWNAAMQKVKAPGKKHQAIRYALAALPVHPQYIDAGTLYFAELNDPLGFGSEPLTAKNSSKLGEQPPPGSLVHALLLTPVSSGTTVKGTEVEAVISQPLFDADHCLVYPEGSKLKGAVVQVEPARHMHRPGQLRLTFREVVPPDGTPQEVAASFEGVQTAANDHIKLDSEGGARATNPKSRYLDTGISLALAAFSSTGDGDADILHNGAGGANSYRLIGLGVMVAVHYTPVGMGMGAFGASRSIYSHFLSRGQEVVFPKDTAMEIGFGKMVTPPAGHTIQQ